MHHASFFLRCATCLFAAAVLLVLPPAAPAQTIDLSLNVFYNNPANLGSGGTWQLVGKSTGAGIASLSARLANIAPTSLNVGPRGTVNGDDPAGFSIFAVTSFSNYRNVLIGQAPLDPAQLGTLEEQSIFYGVGTLTNGAPNWPGKPPGTNSVGPAFTSLTNVQNVPWATGDAFSDPAWNTAAALASGTFATGVTPAFFPGTTGQVFTTIGTNKFFGNIAPATINTIVRTNFTGTGLPGDYNQDAKVDAADFVLWRKNNGTSNPLPNDGGLGVPISDAHYNLWRSNFGMMNGAGAGAGAIVSAVPEPTTAALLALTSSLVLATRRRQRPH